LKTAARVLGINKKMEERNRKIGLGRSGQFALLNSMRRAISTGRLDNSVVVFLFVCLFICLFVYLFVCLFICSFVYLFICLFISLFIWFCIFVQSFISFILNCVDLRKMIIRDANTVVRIQQNVLTPFSVDARKVIACDK
jgi:hypothetical protein